jgi:hypothetical protein
MSSCRACCGRVRYAEVRAAAVIDFELTEHQFGELTYAAFDALQERHKRKFREQRFAAGIVAAAVANCAMGRAAKSRVFTALDFVPDWGNVEEEEIPLTDEEMIESMKKFFGVGPGKPN